MKAVGRNLAEREMHWNDDRRLVARVRGEIARRVDFFEIGVGLRGAEPVAVAPEGLALVAARARQRRMERQPMIFPPALAIAEPAEQVGGQHCAIGVDHRFLGRDIVAQRGTQAIGRGIVAQHLGGVVDILHAADRDRIDQRSGIHWGCEPVDRQFFCLFSHGGNYFIVAGKSQCRSHKRSTVLAMMFF